MRQGFPSIHHTTHWQGAGRGPWALFPAWGGGGCGRGHYILCPGSQARLHPVCTDSAIKWDRELPPSPTCISSLPGVEAQNI